MTSYRRVIAAIATVVFSLAFGAGASEAQSFTVTAAPTQLTLFPGQQGVPITVTTSSNDYSGPITVSMTGLPSGVSVAPVTVMAGSSATLKLNATIFAGQEGFPVTLAEVTSWTAQPEVVGVAGSSTATAPLALTISITNPGFAPAASAINLPILKIDTSGTAIVDKVTNVPGTITITDASGQNSYLPNANDTDNTGTFHLHGNTTLLMPKKAYHVKLNTSLDLLNAMGLVCPYVAKGKATCDKSKSYILLANYDDKTLLHDWSASALASSIPIGGDYLGETADSPTPSGSSTIVPWAPHSLFVELYVNGQYEGNYQLIEEVKVDSHRVNINELAETDATDDITGGYLMEIDVRRAEDYSFLTPQNIPVGLTDPDYTPEVPEQTSYITNYVDTAETALFSSNFTDPVQGWRAYFDEASAVNYYIVNEIMGNPDAEDFGSSVYLYKDKDNPLIYMGPVWDFDICCGNVYYGGFNAPYTLQMQSKAAWYTQWFKDPAFAADVTKQFNALRDNGVFSAWLASIKAQSKTLEQSSVNNFGRWPMLGIEVWPNPGVWGSYDGEVDETINWITARMSAMDASFNNKVATATAFTQYPTTVQLAAPVTLAAKVTGGTNPTGTISFYSWSVLVGSAPLTNGTATMQFSTLPYVGSNRMKAIYSGDSANAPSTAGATITATATPVATFTSITGPVAVSGGSLSFPIAVIPNVQTAAPTGSVTVMLDGGSVMTALDGAGRASVTSSALAVGPHTVAASYSGDANYAVSSSNSLTFTVSNPGVVSLSPTSLTFSNQDLTTSSAAQVVTLSNTGGSAVSITSIVATGDFTETNTCGTSVAAAGNCTISVMFAPTQAGARMGTLTITDNATGSPQTVALTGTGTTPGITVGVATGGSTTATVTSGQSATYNLSLVASAGFSGAVSVTCGGLPTNASCAISPLPMTVADGSTTPFTVRIATTSGVTPVVAHKILRGAFGPLMLVVSALLLMARVRMRRAVLQAVSLLVLAAGLVEGIAGCGGSSSTSPTSTTTPAGTYTVTVTATATGGTASGSQALTLIVQ